MPSSRNPYTGRRIRTPGRRLWITPLFIVIAVILTITLYSALDNGRVVVRRVRVTVSNLPAALEGFTILQASDLSGVRFGAKQITLQKTAANLSYNIVCITGDWTGPAGDTAPFLEMISAFDLTKPIFFIPGDADTGYNPEDPNDPYAAARKLGARFLDATASVSIRGETVWLTPEGQLIENTPDDALVAVRAQIASLRSSAASVGAYQAISSAERIAESLEREVAARGQIKLGDMHIVIMHKPLDASRAALVDAWSLSGDPFYQSIRAFIAGHLAGGQWRIPALGAIYIPGMGFMPKDVEGRTFVSGWPQVISAGLGNSSDTPFPRFRLFNTPELTLITFTRDLD